MSESKQAEAALLHRTSSLSTLVSSLYTNKVTLDMYYIYQKKDQQSFL